MAEVPMVRSTSSVAAGVPRAFALTTGGFVDTGFDLSNIDGRPHSLSLRFMLQYTNSYYNPFVGASGGGSYLVGKSDVVSEPRSPDPPGLTVNIDGERLDFAFPYLGQGLESGHWYSLVLSIDSARLVSVFLDEQELSSREPQTRPLPASGWATGTLLLGQRRSVKRVEQMFGLLDDIAIWDHPLFPAEIGSLAAGGQPRNGDPGLIAGWSADDVPRGRASQPFRLFGTAAVVPNTRNDDDSSLFLRTVQSTSLFLPLKGPCFVAQGVNSSSPAPDRTPNSHRGFAAFALDLAIRDKNGKDLRGATVRAIADGTVVYLRDTSPDDRPNQEVPGCTRCRLPDGQMDDHSCVYRPNEVVIQHAPDEFSQYQHLAQASIPASIKERLANGSPVFAGEPLGQVGQSGTGGYHLHFAYLHAPTLPQERGLNPGRDIPDLQRGCGFKPGIDDYGDILTRPFEFTNYQVRQADGTFSLIPRGVPALGQTIMDGTGSLLSATGNVSWLRANELGTGYGANDDRLDAEVIFSLDTDARLALGIPLRVDATLPARLAMLRVVRGAFRDRRPLAVDYIATGIRTGQAVRVKYIA